MKLAVIDCGTNTFNLLVTEVGPTGLYKKLYNTRIPVRLGETRVNQGYINVTAFNRGLEAIGQFKLLLSEFVVEKVLAFATSAIRESNNGQLFVETVKQLHQIEIEVIDGNREAELIYFGNRGAVNLGETVSLIMDIGGGSNEFILADKNGIFWKQSFMIGAARLLEKFPHSSPISDAEKKQIIAYLNAQLQPLFTAVNLYKPTQLVGSSGAFESLIEMIAAELGGETLKEDKTEYEIDLLKNQQISELVFKSTESERKQIKGLVPMRADMMVISCLMINHIIDTFDLKKLKVSTFSLKEGALLDYIRKNIQ